MAVLEKMHPSEVALSISEAGNDILGALDRLRKLPSSGHKAVNPIRGLMVFDRNQLYVVKPIGQRYWTETAALNDADEIAGTILMHPSKE